MKHLIKKIIKEQSEGLSKIELAVFNRLKSRKEEPYVDPISTYKSIKSLGFDENESRELLKLYINNYQNNVDYSTLKNINRSNELDDIYFSIFFDNLFDPDEVNYTHPMGDSDDNYDHEDYNRIEFYTGDYEFGDNTIFRWYGKDYWDRDNKHDIDFSPMVILEDIDLKNNLMEIFGESWTQPFMEWITNNFGVEVKHIDIT